MLRFLMILVYILVIVTLIYVINYFSNFVQRFLEYIKSEKQLNEILKSIEKEERK